MTHIGPSRQLAMTSTKESITSKVEFFRCSSVFRSGDILVSPRHKTINRLRKEVNIGGGGGDDEGGVESGVIAKCLSIQKFLYQT